MLVKSYKIQSVFLYFNSLSYLLRYSLTVLSVALAIFATQYIPVIGQRAVFLAFFFAITQSAFWLGVYPGIFAMVLSFTAINAHFMLPVWVSKPYEALILNTGFGLLSAIFIATISLHRKLTAKLLEKQQDLDFAQTIGNIGNWRLDVHLNKLDWSDENHRIFGLPKGTPMTYETFLSTIHPEDRDYVDRKWHAALQGEPYDIEHRIIVVGEVKWVRERAELEFDNKGKLLGGFGTTQDITDRKLIQQELLESQQQYADIVGSAMDAIITVDSKHTILVFNPAAEHMFGCPANQVIGGSLARFIPENLRHTHKMHIDAFGRAANKSRKMGRVGIIKGLRASGDEFPIEVSISQSGNDGKKYFTAVLRDISERFRAESVLRDQLRLKDQLAKVAESAPGLICSFRLSPDGSASMPYASPAIESLYGLPHELVANDFSPILTRIHPDDNGHVNDTITVSAKTLQPWHDAFRYEHPTKGEIWIEGHSMPQRDSDGSIIWHGYIQDITERKKGEAELQERTARYELVLNGAQDAIWDWDVQNKRVHYSSRWKALRGFSNYEVSDAEEEWISGIHPDDKSRVLAAVQSHFEGKTPIFCEEYQIRCKDGSWKWILDRGIAQKDETGRIVRMAGSESDISVRKFAENALLERENHLRLIMDATPALISYLDSDFRYLRVNKTYENWFCFHQEQILGHSAREIVGEKAWEIVSPYLERARSGERVSFDYKIPYGTGKPRWVHGTYIPDKDTSGEVIGIVVHVVDIEDRKQAENEIKLLNQNLQRRIEEMEVIFNTVPIGLAIADDPEGYHIRGNPANERLLGLPAGSELSKKIDGIGTYRVLKDGHELAVDKLPMQRAISGEIVNNQVIEVLRPDGKTVVLIANASPLLNEDGLPRGAIGAFLDITQLKQTEAMVRESEERMRLATEATGVGIWEWNVITNQIRWDAQMFRIYGIKPTQDGFIEYPAWSGSVVTEDLPYQEEVLKNIARHGGHSSREFRILHAGDKDIRYIYSVETARKNGSGEIEWVVGTNLDVTERKLSEAKLRENETRLTLVIEEVKAGYWDWDLKTNKLYLSPEWNRQLGLDDAESFLEWNRENDRLHPDDKAMVTAATESFIAGRQPNFELQFRMRHKDGLYRWIHSRGAIICDGDNQPTRMLGLNLDITDYIKDQELRVGRDEMEKSFRLYVASQTAAAIAHELNQPLTAISYYAFVMQEMLKSGNQNPQKLANVMEKCGQQAQRAGDVIQQLLALLHKGETIIEPVDINKSVNYALDLTKAYLQKYKFKFDLDLDESLPLVSSNSLQVQKVLVNLMNNAIESMYESGKGEGTIRVATCRFPSDPTMAQTSVKDSGLIAPGIDSLNKIFQPFFTTKSTGLGMGLAISRALIEAHGGKMWAEKNIDNGITVLFTLPFVI